jgi:formate-dependent nitrite reductase membrane component NrfD
VRTRAERDEQTLDIATALLGASCLWGVVLGVGLVVLDRLGRLGTGAQHALPVVFLAYGATVVGWLVVRQRRSRARR